MTTKTVIVAAAVAALGVYLFKINRASADELSRLRKVLAGHLLDPYPDDEPGGTIGIGVCATDGPFAGECSYGDGGHT